MANVTVRNLPDNIYQVLKKRAKENRRSLNQEIVQCLEKASSDGEPIDTSAFLRDLKKFHRKVGMVSLTPSEIRDARNKGRP